jgi:hypothetical protein
MVGLEEVVGVVQETKVLVILHLLVRLKEIMVVVDQLIT